MFGITILQVLLEDHDKKVFSFMLAAGFWIVESWKRINNLPEAVAKLSQYSR
ncbi:hypothetical protein MTBBW1_450007 [Desulfamplus magnetovallimortis]|uniref:Uncharacterized protein n=1 Tax=Desulfamplus magnetovallimortis TaxID=1246637 RepID=A0A1W1HHB7_9BACT|nr:hypothetical protein MTBBW1_450007 [Desulfamplus magnetovallimortis]